MTKSQLIAVLIAQFPQMDAADVDMAARQLLGYLSDALVGGDRIEVRGFGSFMLHYRAPRGGRNPKTGATIQLPGRYVPRFKPGKALRQRVDATKNSKGNN